jgi:hypothetical protein
MNESGKGFSHPPVPTRNQDAGAACRCDVDELSNLFPIGTASGGVSGNRNGLDDPRVDTCLMHNATS